NLRSGRRFFRRHGTGDRTNFRFADSSGPARQEPWCLSRPEQRGPRLVRSLDWLPGQRSRTPAALPDADLSRDVGGAGGGEPPGIYVRVRRWADLPRSTAAQPEAGVSRVVALDSIRQTTRCALGHATALF